MEVGMGRDPVQKPGSRDQGPGTRDQGPGTETENSQPTQIVNIKLCCEIDLIKGNAPGPACEMSCKCESGNGNFSGIGTNAGLSLRFNFSSRRN